MKNKSLRILVLMIVLLASVVVASIETQLSAGTGQPEEYQVKAAFLFNFIRFIDWPNEQTADANGPIFIGIIGSDPFGDAFEPAKSRSVKGRKVIVSRFQSFAELEKNGDKNKLENELRKCHLLFISPSEKEKTREIIQLLGNSPVLTVGETPNLLEIGGIIRLLTEEKKVCFEINLRTAEQVNLRISSQLLRLAKRVIKDNPVSMNKPEDKSKPEIM